MTIMRVSVTGIKLQPEIKADLARRLIEEFATVEVGQFSEAIAAGFTVQLEELEPENLWMGLQPAGKAHPSGKFIVITAQVMAGPWNLEMKKEVISRLDRAVREILEIPSKNAGTNIWVTIVEIPNGSFGVGGKVVSISELSPFFTEDRQKRIREYLNQ